MAHIVCMTNGLAGLLLASFEMVRRLRIEGHSITYMAPSSAETAATEEGLRFEQLPDLRGASEADLDTFAERLAGLRPDLALIDTELPEAVLASQAAGLKTVLLNTWMSIWKHPGLPPLHRPIRPGIGFFGTKVGIELAWYRHLMTRRLMDTLREWKQSRSYHVAGMRAYARKIGFPYRQEFDFDNWLLPFSFKSMPIMVLHAQEFEFSHQPRTHVHYVGPMVNPDRIDSRCDPDDQARIDTILTRRQMRQSRLVFGGFGSFFTADKDLLHRVFEAFARRPDWDLVLPLGKRRKEFETETLPLNVHVFEWAPQLSLLRHADAAIVHGGINTIDECIHFKTPMLAYSGGITDMPGNIARLVHHRLGFEGDSRHDTTGQIIERLDHLMSDRHVAKSLEEHQAAAHHYRRAHVLERLIDRFLEGDLAMSAAPLTSTVAGDQRGSVSRP
jgi:UDP:flavonoid glycosyltransferase YjiC (YdhE family)